ncbi:MAG: flagellar hook-length control protein FliK [Mariprofundus sp.]|nr:flagellar hook-length control protein FliK [Mariprofundus sp.]
MPDRRIDAIGKTDATAWNSTQLPKGSPNMVRVLSGVLSNASTGSVMHAMVQKAANDAFKITLNGEPFVIKGLPASLAGKEVAFIVQKSSTLPNAKAELFWVGASQTGALGKQTQGAQTATSGQQSQGLAANSKHANILSTLPTGVKTNQTLSGQIASIHGKQMSITIMVPDGKGQSTPHIIQTTTIAGLKEGQQIAARVVMGSNNKSMLEILPQQNTNQVSGKQATPVNKMAHFTLAAGDRAAAFVQQRLDNGNVQLNIQGKIVETAAPANVQKGDVLMLKMNKPPSDFQLLSIHKNAAAKALGTLKANLVGNTQSMAQHITNIRNIIPNIPVNEATPMSPLPLLESSLKTHEISSSQPLTGDRLMQMMRNAGSGLEAKLLQLSQNPALSPAMQQDLKSIMLQIANQQGGNTHQNELVRAISELAQQSVSRIETTQALNVLAQVQGEPTRIELPMLVNQQMVNVQLSMQQQSSYEQNSSEENGSANQSFNVLFSLELSQLGNIRVDANISDNTVHARIYNDNSTCSRFLLDNIQRLEERLHQLGFEKVYLVASQQQPSVEKQRSFDQLTQMLPASLNLLDIRI